MNYIVISIFLLEFGCSSNNWFMIRNMTLCVQAKDSGSHNINLVAYVTINSDMKWKSLGELKSWLNS